ncbi:MAG TPA: 7,8-didemethyl-8-hydroxy-5-deazariboflavin synthase CofG [Candidatus Eisenbacteria bacterium]|nr:7,8-didemethyl-8-hydroxy-5-deazariboflavin synthase CofG [Candidatus Eisenbacteria bacterium]
MSAGSKTRPLSKGLTRAGMSEYLREVRDGRPVSRADAISLLQCSPEVLPDLLATACFLKEQYRPGIITYSRKVFVPLTNLCRDYCGYCTYRRDPGQSGAHTMRPEEVLEVVRQGEKLGCTEALFSLGDKPEAEFPEMRELLRKRGYRSTLHYLEAMCELVLRETSLLPHSNPGLMTASWIERLRATNPSLGLMLETASDRLSHAGGPHLNAPDKVPSRRLKTIEDAGKLGVPFTTGILIGIGETYEERVDALLAIQRLHQQYGHIQEVIIQNFRAKPGIPMAHAPEPDTDELLRTIAVARLLLRDMNIQAPPNLTEHRYERLLQGGIDDWGGISPLTPDYINPEAPWPHLADLERRTEAAGHQLRQRLPVYPEFVSGVVDRGGLLAGRLLAASDEHGYARAA